jgi:hypothetical protein
VYRRGISIFESDCIILKDEAATDLQTPCSNPSSKTRVEADLRKLSSKSRFSGLSIVGKFASNQRAGRREPSELNATYPPRKYYDLSLVLYIGLQRRKVAIDSLHKILEGNKR